MNYFSYGFIHFSSIEQKNKFFNFVKNKELKSKKNTVSNNAQNSSIGKLSFLL